MYIAFTLRENQFKGHGIAKGAMVEFRLSKIWSANQEEYLFKNAVHLFHGPEYS